MYPTPKNCELLLKNFILKIKIIYHKTNMIFLTNKYIEMEECFIVQGKLFVLMAYASEVFRLKTYMHWYPAFLKERLADLKCQYNIALVSLHIYTRGMNELIKLC